MAEAVDQAHHEFWRPPMAASGLIGHTDRTATCGCGSEFIVSSLYCHACGASRPDAASARVLEIPGVSELSALGCRLGLTTASVTAFLIGLICIVGALCVSLFFSVRTVLDWQAIQMWRIEWLLASIAAFIAGVLLKK
jgi:hypothetical protein